MAKVTFEGTVEEILELLKGTRAIQVEVGPSDLPEDELSVEDAFTFCRDYLNPSTKWVLREDGCSTDMRDAIVGTEERWRWVVAHLRSPLALESGLILSLGGISLRGYFNGDCSLESVSIKDESNESGACISVNSCEEWLGVKVNEILTLANFIEHNLDGKPGQSAVVKA